MNEQSRKCVCSHCRLF